jgi:hypothetical protein
MTNLKVRYAFAAALSVVFIGLTGCSEPADDPKFQSDMPPDSGAAADADEVLHPEEVGGDGAGSLIPMSLCQLVKMVQNVGGVYEVTDITQYPSAHPGKTYVDLKKQAGWSSESIEDPTIEVNEGPKANGMYYAKGSTPHVQVGETYIVLFHGMKGDWMYTGQSIFRNSNGDGYTNGFLFEDNPLPKSELKAKVVDLYQGVQSGDGCPYDVEPDGPGERPDAGPETSKDVTLEADAG